MICQSEISKIGRFQKTHALKGELNAILDIPEEFLTENNALIVDVDGIFVPFYADTVRPKGATTFLIKLDGIDSEIEAKAFVNKTIYGLKSELAPFLKLDEEELLSEDDLLDYVILDARSDKYIGNVIEIDSATDNLLFVVENNEGDTIFIPAVDEFIDRIDEEEKKIWMNIPEGLLELNKKK